MGAHAGIFFFDGRPVEDACSMAGANLSPMSPDGPVSVYAAPGIAMAQAAFHVWTGEHSSPRPARSPSGLIVCWDGRIDNRHDLLLRLGPICGSAEPGDAAIAAAAFERWGLDGLRAIVGEWSVAIWDPAQRMLHLARDYMGVRSLYYSANGQSIAWSSALAEIVVRSGRGDDLNEEFVARFMALRPSGELTPYAGVLAVPAGTCLSFATTGARIRRRYWNPSPGAIRFKDRRHYEEQLRALWTEAVGARLRACGTVWAELSGGFDSSSVVCMAGALIEQRRVPARAVQPISHVTLQSPEGDERRFIAEVEARIGASSRMVGVEAHRHLADPDLEWVTPLAVRGVVLALARHVQEDGGRVVLSGRAGDVVMGCEPDNSIAVLDDFAAGHILHGLSNLRRWSLASKKPFIELAWQLHRRGTRSGLARALERRAAGHHAAGTALLTSRLQDMARSAGRELASLVAGLRPSARELAARVLAYPAGSQLSHQIRPAQIVYTYPYTHRPLIEFVLAIPREELSGPGEMRWLMRRAFEGLVPPRILRRISKGYYPPSALRNVRLQVAAIRAVEDLEVVRRGWIDPRRLDAAIRLLLDSGGGAGGEVEAVLRLEQWVESRKRRARAGTPQRKEVRTDEVLNA